MNIYIGDIQLPVVEPTFQIEEMHDNTEEQIVGFGGVNLIGKKSLKTFSYSSFYPKRYDRSYCMFSDLLEPMEFVNKILEIKDGVNKTRLIIPKYDINDLYSINAFSYRPEDGTGDVYYSIQMSECPNITLAAVNYVYENAAIRDVKVVEPNYYVIKEGDTIVSIARKFNLMVNVLYMDNKNVIGNNPTNVKVGMKLFIRGNVNANNNT